jgi:hypothetical protein
MPTHKCRRPSCEKMVPQDHLACKDDWFLLPQFIRSEIWDQFRLIQRLPHRRHTQPGSPADHNAYGAYRTAVEAAVTFWKELERNGK